MNRILSILRKKGYMQAGLSICNTFAQPSVLSIFRTDISRVDLNMASAAELVLSGEAKKEFWQTATSAYDALDWQKKITDSIIDLIQSNDSWLNLTSPPTQEAKILDYACGPGVVSLSLLPYATSVLGMDINAQQVAEYNRRAAGSNLPPSLVRAETGNLLSNDSEEAAKIPAGFTEFDYAFCSLAFHHVDDPAGGVKKLAERVKSGGKVVIIEFIGREKDGSVIGLHPDDSDAEKERKAMNKEYERTSHDNMHLINMIKKNFHKDNEGSEASAAAGDAHQHGHGGDHQQGGHHHGHHHHHGEGEGGEKRKGGHGPHGFMIEQMKQMFTDAGLVDVDSVVFPEKLEIMQFGGWEVFMTKGSKL